MNIYSLGRALLCVAVTAMSANPPAAVAQVEPAATTNNLSMSANSASHRAQWQQHLTLGPGDTLNISLLIFTPGAAPNTVFTPAQSRIEVPVGPDGRITFLQARNVLAAGLTVDELRAKLDETLATYYQNPRTIVIPVAIHSKKYVVLGAVAGRGVYPFERPVTVIEAIARAGGLPCTEHTS